MLAKGFHYRENDLTRRGLDRIALQIIETAINICFLIGIQAVKVHHLQQWGTVDFSGGDISQFVTRGVTQVFNVQFEVVFLDLVGTQGIDIFHRQIPHGIVRR